MIPKILLIDDDVLVLKTLRRLLLKKGYEVEDVKTADDGLQKVKSQSFQLILCDLRMPKVNGIEFIRSVRKIEADKNQITPVIFMTGYTDEDMQIEAEKLKPAAYLLKPFNIDLVIESIEKILATGN